MSYIPTPEQAEELVKRFNKEPFHIQHVETVSKVMGEFAKEYDPENVDFWRTVGMLHETAEKNRLRKTALIVVGGCLGKEYLRSMLYHPDFTTEYRKGNA